jgi:CRP-like cAMP-binding protein
MTLAKNPAGGGNNSASSFKREASRKKADPARLSGSWVIPDDTRRAIEHCELFRDVTKVQLMQIAALVEEYTLEPEEMLLTEGEPARHIMVVVEGQAVAQPKLNQGWISLGLVGPNEIAGWSSLLDGQAYPASVLALTPMRVAAIETTDLTLLMNLDPGIGYPIHRRLSTIFHRQYQAALQAIKTSV